MDLLWGDCLLVGVAATLIVLGLCRGLSGVFAFAAGLAFAAAAGVFCWSRLGAAVESPVLRAMAAVVLFVVAFGLVRWAVKWLVGKILTQPSDSIFGVCFGLFCAALMFWAVSENPDAREYSRLAQKVHEHVCGDGAEQR